MATIVEIIKVLEQLAPATYQEDYDNSGLIVGNISTEVKSILVCLDTTEEVIAEAIQLGANLIIAHHPILFKGLKKITGKTYVERVLIQAIQNDIAIYAIHTNLDNVLHSGVCSKMGEKLGLLNTQILSPKKGILNKIITYVPTEHIDIVQQAMFEAGAGKIGNYDYCSFIQSGTGTFRANEKANPSFGKKGEFHREPELKLELICPDPYISQVISAMKKAHPYEEVAYDIIKLENVNQEIGSGLIGELPEPASKKEFLHRVATLFKSDIIRYTEVKELKEIKKVALCGGAGSFLVSRAINQKADVFISADFKYHEFFDAENKLMILDIGHYESEQYTIDLLYDVLSQNFSIFAIHKTKVNTNPVQYFHL